MKTYYKNIKENYSFKAVYNFLESCISEHEEEQFTMESVEIDFFDCFVSISGIEVSQSFNMRNGNLEWLEVCIDSAIKSDNETEEETKLNEGEFENLLNQN